MEIMSNTFTSFLVKTSKLNITMLHFLHYAAAVTLAGVEDHRSETLKTKHDPDRSITEIISDLRSGSEE